MRLDDIIGCLTRREDDRGWTNEKRNGKPVMKRQRRLVEREQRATVLLNRERERFFFWIFTLCLFVHGPDFWIFDWEHNKSARVLPEKWLHLLFLQFVVVRIKTKRLF